MDDDLIRARLIVLAFWLSILFFWGPLIYLVVNW